MLNEQEYITQSLELHLFFARIMKEHSIFLEAGFTPKNANWAQYADELKLSFEDILSRTVSLSNGLVRREVLESGEIVTDYTLSAEQKTANLTGININSNITAMETRFSNLNVSYLTPQLLMSVRQINQNTMILLNDIITFKTNLLNEVLSCNMFTANYPLLIEHILREAKLYQKELNNIENGISLDNEDIKELELFWDLQMMEHALFIRGLLDPTENELILKSNDFAKDYSALLEESMKSADIAITNMTNKTIEKTIEFKNFKTAGVKGISDCKIHSIILPLLADHVLREANHFIRILKT